MAKNKEPARRDPLSDDLLLEESDIQHARRFIITRTLPISHVKRFWLKATVQPKSFKVKPPKKLSDERRK